MHNQARPKTLAVATLLLVGTLATGCGGGNAKATRKAAPAPSLSSSTMGTPSTTTTTGTSSAFCAALRDQLAGLSAQFPTDFTDVQQIKRYGQYLKTTNAKLVTTAPPEIAADVRSQVQASNAVADYYVIGRLTPPAAVQNQLRSPQYRAAATRLSQFATTKCGIRPSPAPSR